MIETAGLAEALCRKWRLRITGREMRGACAVVLPVVRAADGMSAVLKLQPVDEETAGEPLALRVWDGDGAVRLLEHDPASGSMLLERLDPSRSLAALADDREAVRIIAGLLARLTAHPAPDGLRRLGDLAQGMLEQVPDAVRRLAYEDERRVLKDCAAAVREVVGEPGDRLLHWDLHYDNVLAVGPAAERGPWLAIDPKPLAGDPGFELMPALRNRFDPEATGWRFDLLTDVLGLDRERARAWTLARVLENCLWDVEDGEDELDEVQLSIARNLLAR